MGKVISDDLLLRVRGQACQVHSAIRLPALPAGPSGSDLHCAGLDRRGRETRLRDRTFSRYVRGGGCQTRRQGCGGGIRCFVPDGSGRTKGDNRGAGRSAGRCVRECRDLWEKFRRRDQRGRLLLHVRCEREGDNGLKMSESDIAALRQYVEQITPLDHLAQPEEIASSALFLASYDARYVNGVESMVDGGLSQI